MSAFATHYWRYSLQYHLTLLIKVIVIKTSVFSADELQLKQTEFI